MAKLEFNYLNLEKYLYEMYKNGIDNINLFLYVSPENKNYHGEHLKRVIVDLINLISNFVFEFDNKKVKFKVNKIYLNVGDVLNRYNHLYRYYRDYLIENNLNDESQIPENIKQDLMTKSYNDGKQLGKDWFKNNMVEALNLILPDNKQISKDFEIKERVVVYEGDEIIPEIEYVSHEYWLKHKDFEKIKKVLDEIKNLENSIIERTFDHVAKLHFERLEKGHFEYPKIFKKCSKLYLLDEIIERILVQQQFNKNLIFYCGGVEPQHHRIFSSKKAKNNEIIQKYIANELRGVTNGNWITIEDRKVS